MSTIVIRNIAQLKAFNKKLKMVSTIFPTLQSKALEMASKDIVLNDIHRDMRANRFSNKIIDATFVGEIQQSKQAAEIHFISDYVSDSGFDVSKGREEGTQDNITRRPKDSNGALRIPLPNGKVIFRKSSTPKGIERLLIIENNIRKNKQKFQEQYGSNISNAFNQMATT